jgi:hypothetical protein
MSAVHDMQDAFHRATARVFAILTPEQTRQLADLQADEQLAVRVSILADKANEGELSDAERAEYEGYIEANDWLAILQAEARVHLNAGMR